MMINVPSEVVAQTLVVNLPEMQDVDVGLEDGLDRRANRVDAHGGCPVDASDGDAVAGLDSVNQLVVHVELDRVRRLAGRHVL